MNLKSTLIKSISLVLLFAAASSLPAQVFWSEDFSGGMPADWTTVDTSGHEVIWSWCGDPLGTVGDCSPIFDDDINGQSPFAATTSDNGFMTVNSDAYNTPASDPHVSILATNAIDCSAQSVVWIKFEAHIGVFDLDANTNAFLRVSTDSITWTDYACFPDLTTTVRWSENPEDVIFDLTDVAAGQSTVYLQWIWTGGWEYFWNLDDVILTSVNPTPPHDIQVNSNWFAIAPNARVPVTQIEQFGFIADVENEGSLNQTNVNLRVTIEDEANLGTFLYDETLGYGTVDAGTLVENVLFPDDGFTPAASVATYVGTYAITSDSSALDAEPEDNTITFDFEVTENLFAKDRGVTRIISPAGGNWDDGEARSWAYGNYYRVVNGDGWWAHNVTFGLGNAEDVAGETIFLKLYKWDDINQDGDVDPDEREELGSANYTIEGTEEASEAGLITIPLLDNASLLEGISLEDNTDYVLMIEYPAISDEINLSFLASGDYDYGAMIFRSDSLEVPRYGSMLGVNDPLSLEPYSSLGFGFDLAPICRMQITDEDPGVSGTATLSADNKVDVFPSPATDYIQVTFDLVDAQDEVVLKIVDMSGKVIAQRQYLDTQLGQAVFDLQNFPTGSYFLHLDSAKGSKNVPFIIQR